MADEITTPKEEIKYPKTYNKCPCCGSDRRYSQEVPLGPNGQRLEGFIEQQPTFLPLESPKIIHSTMEGLLLTKDGCIDCGNVYIVKATKLKVQVQMAPQQGKQCGGGNGHGIGGFGLG